MIRSRFLALALPLALALALALVPAALAADPEPGGGPAAFKYLKYRSIGPTAGGRVSRATGVPGDPLTYYAATSAGGVWKSADGGHSWKPIFDDQPISSIGSIAVAPSDPNIVYVGSGEANIRGNVAAGNGIYKSTDAGQTWQHVWKQEGQIGTLIVHPTHPELAYAAVLGHAFGPNPERGIYRTADGGKSWQQVLAKNPDTGASDVCFDPANPRILFAGLWQTRRRPWDFTSGGPGSGLYTSRDGGDTWTQFGGGDLPAEKIAEGLPKGIWGKVCVAVAPSDGRRVYALIEAEKGGLYGSTDGGKTWKLINGRHYLRQRPWYFSTITVDPRNPDVVWAPTVYLLQSIDGGKTFQRVKGPHHGDHHDIWIDPRNPRRIIDSNDGGVDLTLNGGETWFWPPLPIAQFYHIIADNHVPYRVSGTMQDLGTASGPSNSLTGAGITLCDWYPVGGGETGFTAPDPVDPEIVYAGEYGGYMSRYDHRTGQARNVSIYPTDPSGHGAEELRYRFQWTAPILISPHDRQVIYHAANVLFQSTDAGGHWKPISPDLTRNDKSKQKWSGGPITGDNTTAEFYDTIFAIAESPRQKGLLWAGSDDGLVHITQDGGSTWTNVTKNIPGLPEWGTICCIEPSPFEAGTAYVVVDAHRLDNMRPYLYRTRDFGKSWKSLAAGLPQDVYLHAVREDLRQKGLLYVGTERGVAFSLDDGFSWQQLKLNLPTVAVHDLVVKKNDLVIGTNGRSVWIFDDLTPIRRFAPPLAEQSVYLFPTQPVIRWRYRPGSYASQGNEGPKNPPNGAVIDYYLKKEPKNPITLEILDAQGTAIRKLSSKESPEETTEEDPDVSPDEPKPTKLFVKAGVNRVVWDLRYQGADIVSRAKIDAGEPRVGPLVAPGTYTLKLTVDGKSLTTRVEVQLDPRIQLPAADLEAELKLALGIRDDISRLAHHVEAIRSLRRQLNSQSALLKNNPRAAPLVKAATGLVGKLDALEEKLHNPKAEVTYDILAQRGGARLYSRLGGLGDWVQESDGPPTQGMREQYAELTKELEQNESAFKALVAGDLARLNDQARKLAIPAIIVPEKGAASP